MIEEFRRASAKKFASMPAESSEIFKYQTSFKDFGNEISKRKMSDGLGFEIVGSAPEGSVSIKPVSKAKGKKMMGRFDIDDKFVQMNNAFFDSGALVEVAKGLGKAGMLRIRSAVDRDTFTKTIIVVGEGSEIDVVKESFSSDDGARNVSEDVLIVAEGEAKASFSELQNYNLQSSVFSNKISVCGPDSSVSWNVGVFGGARTRTRGYNFMEGDGSSVEDLQLTFGSGVQTFDSFSNLIHIGKSTSGKSMAKGAFRDSSSSISKGMIKIGGKAKNASSFLACHGMLLSPTARCNAVPGLEIETNDVKATHAASVSPIDPEKIFYLMARGISEPDARRMVTLGFFDPLIVRMGSREIQAKVRYILESKWNGRAVGMFDERTLMDLMTEDAIKSGDVFEGHYKYRR